MLSSPIFQFGLFLLLGGLYGLVSTAVSRNLFLTLWDVPFGSWLISRYTPLGEAIFTRITDLGSYLVIRAFALLTCLGLILAGEWRRVIMLLGVIALAMIVSHYMRLIVPRPRPEFPQNFLYGVNSSYPSGHTLLATAFYLFIAYLGWIYPQADEIQWSIVAFIFLLICLIGFSRVYLGLHFLTDVLGGWIAGSMIFFFVLTVGNILFFKPGLTG